MTLASEATTIEAVTVPKSWGGGIDSSDPYRYGWRYARHRRPDGSEELEQVPLTLEDVLHPEEEDFIVQNDAHEHLCRYLCDVFEAQTADDPTAVVLHDVRISWDHPGLKAHGPDVAVIFGVRERKAWSTFDVAEEGVRPELIVEVVSPQTASTDRVNKVEEYDLAGVSLYVIVDMVMLSRPTMLRLIGYTRMEGGGYQLFYPDERGWLWLAPVRTWLGIENGAVVCYNEAGTPLGNYRALSRALAEAVSAREAAEARIQELEATIRRLKGEE